MRQLRVGFAVIIVSMPLVVRSRLIHWFLPPPGPGSEPLSPVGLIRSRTPVPALIISSFELVQKYCTEPDTVALALLNLRPASWPVPLEVFGRLPRGSLAFAM